MSRVRQQGYRVGEQAKRKLHCNESHIEADANGKGCAEVCRSVNVPGAMGMVMVGWLSMHSMIVIHGYPFNPGAGHRSTIFYAGGFARVLKFCKWPANRTRPRPNFA